MDCRDGKGWTALHHAVQTDSEDCVRMLIRAGADINAVTSKSWDGTTPLRLAVFGSRNVLHLLLTTPGLRFDHAQSRSGNTVLHRLALEGLEDEARTLVQAGCDVGMLNKAGLTPLVLAMSAGHHGVVQLLLTTPAFKIDQRDMTGDSYLHRAVEYRCITCLSLLLQQGCDTETRDGRGCTPLMATVAENWLEGCEALVQAGAVVSEESMRGTCVWDALLWLGLRWVV